MKKEETGYIKLKKVLKTVAKQYKIKKENIEVNSSYYNTTVVFKFDTSNENKYSIKETISLNLEDITEIVLNILKEDNISATNVVPKFEHVEGDSFEPLDYGYYKLKGFNFSVN